MPIIAFRSTRMFLRIHGYVHRPRQSVICSIQGWRIVRWTSARTIPAGMSWPGAHWGWLEYGRSSRSSHGDEQTQCSPQASFQARKIPLAGRRHNLLLQSKWEAGMVAIEIGESTADDLKFILSRSEEHTSELQSLMRN